MPLANEELTVAIEENPEGLFKLLAEHTPGVLFKRDAFMRRMCFGVPIPFFNGVAMAKFDERNCDAKIEEAIQELQSTGMPWSWQVGPGCTPADLAERLTDHDMQFSYDMPLMTASLDGWQPRPLPKGLSIEPVNDMRRYDQWCDVAQVAFKLPTFVFDIFKKAQAAIGFGHDVQLENYLGLSNGEPVCTGTVFFSHGIAGIYTIGTPADHRGRGYGLAITEACMARAKQKGYETAFLQSSKMGFPIYQKIGFQEVSRLSMFVPIDA